MKRPQRKRLDEFLVENGWVKDLREAEVMIRLGRVRESKSGKLLDTPGTSVRSDLQIVVDEKPEFVSRGGIKLARFLDEAQIDLKGAVALDVGSSTGGFTDCLLARGVQKVAAVDVGKHQLHEKLRVDSRVELFEETDIRKFDLAEHHLSPRLVVVDVSFISLKLIAQSLFSQAPEATFIFLFKPQFEVGVFVPKKRGVAPKSESDKSLQEMLLFLRSLGLNPSMVRESAIKGTKGNQEVFIMAESSIPRHIFRTYDIRGRAETDLKSPTIEKVGRAFAKRVLEKVGKSAVVAVGRDARESSPRIFEALCRGLFSQGLKVVDLGLVTTPMAYFAHYNFDVDALVMVTASHNPKDDNGMKMMIAKDTLFGDDIKSLGVHADHEVLGPTSFSTPLPPSIETQLATKYIDYLHSHIKLSRKFKIVLDCGNGMVGSVARKVFSPYASQLEILYENVDCRFPNHEADPTIPANLVDLQAAVKKHQADIGFSFDGDGDRLGVITRSGRILWGDEILMLLSELVLKSKPGSMIIGEVKCSEKLFRMIEDRGGVPVMYKTGHSLIKKKMREIHAPIAGEMSGHLFFADRYFGFDDACYGALRVLEVLDQLKIEPDEWISKYPISFVTPEIRVECAEEDKERLVEQVKTYFAKSPGANLNVIDGVRVGFSDHSWALVRASNTQAVLVLRIEALSKKRLIELGKELSQALGRSVEISENV